MVTVLRWMHFEHRMYMFCVSYVMYGLDVVVNVAVALLSFVRPRSWSDVAMTFAMARLLTCKTKTWREYVRGCILVGIT